MLNIPKLMIRINSQGLLLLILLILLSLLNFLGHIMHRTNFLQQENWYLWNLYFFES